MLKQMRWATKLRFGPSATSTLTTATRATATDTRATATRDGRAKPKETVVQQPSCADGKAQTPSVFDLDYQQMQDFVQSCNYPRYRAEQLWRAIYDEGIRDFDKIQGLPQNMRRHLANTFTANVGTIREEQISSDGTCKWLMDLPHGLSVETVFIPEGKRGTLCISSQVGCSLACSFCHTGTQKFQRNLKHADIVGQFLLAKERINSMNSQSKITNIVYMGQGEPLLNWRNVFRTARTFCDDKGLNYGKSKVTISTVGVAPKIHNVGTETGVGLAVSLHSAIDEIRSRIMAINKSYPLKELHKTCNDYLEAVKDQGKSRTRDNRITFEYTLLNGINDDKRSLEALKTWCQSLGKEHSHVNLIPYNEWPGSPWSPSPDSRVMEFQEELKRANVFSTIRWPRGRDILAACGQLNSASDIS